MIKKNHIDYYNSLLKCKAPDQIISFCLQHAKKPIATTSFGKYSASLLHAIHTHQKDHIIKIIWCDTGYNTQETYAHAQAMIQKLQLDITICTPQLSTAYLNHKYGIPGIENPNHHIISDITKVNPLKKTIAKYAPDMWFTNIRKQQNAYRHTLDILSIDSSGIIKVAPFFYWKDEEIETYMSDHNLPLLMDYYDPIKAVKHRECGIHLG